jgi:inosine-uridine nucleoside N-ribohydrolase
LSAVDAILKLAAENPHQLKLVTLGPLTNAAAAFLKFAAISLFFLFFSHFFHRNPAQFRLLKEIVIMGGAFGRYGNITLTAEYNIAVDPEAASILCESGVPLVFVPLNVTEEVSFIQLHILSLFSISISSY